MSASHRNPAEFTCNFGRYRMKAQREAVAVSSHGHITGYFIRPEEYEAFLRFKSACQSFATADLSEDEVEAIASARMHPRHDRLNALLDPE
jgi:hypothetical protein